MDKFLFKILLIMSVLLLSGCIRSSVEVTPESMRGKGLLVGHVSASNFGLGNFFRNGEVHIGDERHKDAYKDGFITVPLAPGKYEMNSLFVPRGNGGYSSLPIKGKFTIKAGEVTNLGEVFLLFPKKTDNRYNMLYLDNNDDMQAFLRTKYADVYKLLQKKKFNRADVKYIKPRYVNKVREQLLSQTYNDKFNHYMVVGALGGIGLYDRDKKGKVKSIKWLDTGTFIGPNDCQVLKKRAACIVPHQTKGDRIFLSDGVRYKFTKKPADFKKGKFRLLKDNSMVWLNDNFSYFRRSKKSNKWNAETAHEVALSGSFFDIYRFSKTPEVYEIKKGFYIFSKLDGSPLLFNQYKSNKSVSLKKPDGKSGIGTLVETTAGLYASPADRTLFSDSEIFFRPKGKEEWEKREIKLTYCGAYKVANYKKDTLTMNCGSDGDFVLSNNGKSWKKIPKKD